jgi:hypothetical protein
MILSSYERKPEIAPDIFERVRGLNVSPVRGLPAFGDSEERPC